MTKTHFAEVLTFIVMKFVRPRMDRKWRYYLISFGVGVGITVVLTLLSHFGYLRPFENKFRDILQHINPTKAHDVAILFITPEEYQEGFSGQSPLSRKRLATVVKALIKHKPRAIAMDLDLSDPTSEDEYFRNTLRLAEENNIPIVIVGKLEPSSHPPEEVPISSPYGEHQPHTTPEGHLLFKSISPGKQWGELVMFGGTIFRLDPDHVLRKAEAVYIVHKIKDNYTGKPSPVPSLPVAAAAAYLGLSQQELLSLLREDPRHILLVDKRKVHGHHDIKIDIHSDGRITPFFLGNYIYFYREHNLNGLMTAPAPGNSIFKDKLVIIGGTYNPNDFFFTPIGRISGVEVMANITQSIINETLVSHLHTVWIILIELSTAMVVSFIFATFYRIWATLISFFAVGGVIFSLSLFLFYFKYHGFDFLLTLLGIALHNWARKWEDYFFHK